MSPAARVSGLGLLGLGLLGPGLLLWTFVAMAVTGGLGCSSTASSQTEPQEEPLPQISVSVLTVQLQPWPQVVRSQGALLADEATVLGAKVAGRVAEVHVDLGDQVAAGAPLVTLDRQEFELQVMQAEAQLLQSRSAVGLRPGDSVNSLEPTNSPPVRQERAVWDEAIAQLSRAKRLQADNAISPLEFEQIVATERVAEAKYSSAINSVHERIAQIEVREAALSLAEQRLADAVILASFDGIIQDRQVSPGTYLQVGDPVATLVRTHILRFRGTIPERYAQQLEVGQQVALKIESIDEIRQVAVTRISPSLDFSTRSLLFEAELANQDRQLRTGLFAQAEIIVDPDATARVIPQSSVVEFAGSEKVWQVVEGVAREIEVLTGERRDDRVAVLSGLADGDVILVEGRQGRVATVSIGD